MSRPPLLALAVALSLAAASLTAWPVAAQEEGAAPAPPSATPNPEPLDRPSGDGTAVRLTTDLGDIVIGLFNESAPVAAENFLNLAQSGFYDEVGFHRVVPGFVVQGGDPEGTGRGGPGYTIADETVVGQYGRGIVAMARTPAPDSQGSQFFFVLDDGAEAALESARTYVIFGRVVEGMDVVDAIAERGPASDLIEDPVRIQSASIEQVELPPEATAPPPTTAELAADVLLGRMPTEIAGVALTTDVFASEQILGGSAESEAIAELTTLATGHGTQIEQLAVATAGSGAGDSFVAILAGSIPGVPASDARDALVQLIVGDSPEAELTDQNIAGKQVVQLMPTPESAPRDNIYIVASGDILWFVVTEPELLEDVIGELP